MLRAVCSVCLFAVLAAVTSIPASAQTVDNRTYFTFSGPVTLPGVTLPAGKYAFRILDTDGSRRLIQVQDVTGRHYGTMMSVPTQMDAVPTKPEIRFMEGTERSIPAVRAWFYPGTSTGYEFVYPQEQAMRLASRGRTPALTNTDPTTNADASKSSTSTRGSSSGSDVPPGASEPKTEAPPIIDVPPSTVPPLPDGASPLTSWLGALSVAMGTVANRGRSCGSDRVGGGGAGAAAYSYARRSAARARELGGTVCGNELPVRCHVGTVIAKLPTFRVRCPQ